MKWQVSFFFLKVFNFSKMTYFFHSHFKEFHLEVLIWKILTHVTHKNLLSVFSDFQSVKVSRDGQVSELLTVACSPASSDPGTMSSRRAAGRAGDGTQKWSTCLAVLAGSIPSTRNKTRNNFWGVSCPVLHSIYNIRMLMS